jgi:catechol 2,3-dioxygenase-like lactoylglutathione lyase family enzyme
VTIDHLFAGIPVADYAAARPWYERFFGREPDMLPHDHEAVWKLTESAWVYVVEDAERAGKGLVTIFVDDLAAWTDQTADHSIPGMRRAEIQDADGNRIQLVQPASPA